MLNHNKKYPAQSAFFTWIILSVVIVSFALAEDFDEPLDVMLKKLFAPDQTELDVFEVKQRLRAVSALSKEECGKDAGGNCDQVDAAVKIWTASKLETARCSQSNHYEVFDRSIGDLRVRSRLDQKNYGRTSNVMSFLSFQKKAFVETCAEHFRVKVHKITDTFLQVGDGRPNILRDFLASRNARGEEPEQVRITESCLDLIMEVRKQSLLSSESGKTAVAQLEGREEFLQYYRSIILTVCSGLSENIAPIELSYTSVKQHVDDLIDDEVKSWLSLGRACNKIILRPVEWEDRIYSAFSKRTKISAFDTIKETFSKVFQPKQDSR